MEVKKLKKIKPNIHNLFSERWILLEVAISYIPMIKLTVEIIKPVIRKKSEIELCIILKYAPITTIIKPTKKDKGKRLFFIIQRFYEYKLSPKIM